MQEEIIIFEQDGNIVGITKEGKYFESYKTTENVAILRGAGLYIKRLEQENKNLKRQIESDKGLITVGGKQQYKYLQEIDELQQENKELKERFEKRGELMCNCANQRENYRSALEEINKIAEPRFVNGVNEEADLCNLAMDRIQNKINEVLNDK